MFNTYIIYSEIFEYTKNVIIYTVYIYKCNVTWGYCPVNKARTESCTSHLLHKTFKRNNWLYYLIVESYIKLRNGA